MRLRKRFRRSNLRAACPWAALLFALGLAGPAAAFVPFARWSNPPAVGFPGGIGGEMGDPLTLTWSIVADDTVIPAQANLNPLSTSSLISFLDTTFGGGVGGTDLTQRPWFSNIQYAFDRWSQLSGLTFIYEPNDDTATPLASGPGVPDVRGDIRLGATFINGAGGTFGYSYFPDTSDMVLDTGDGAFFSNAFDNHRQFRNAIMHELGHGLGLNHVLSDTSTFLMRSVVGTGIHGPQLDDILGIHAYYGDALEKTNAGLGNDSAALAHSLGTIAIGGSDSIGTSAAPDVVVAGADVDFVSIDNASDVDFYSLTITAPARVNVVLTPLGGTYNQGPIGQTPMPFHATAANDLALAVFDTDGTTLLALANDFEEGFAESLEKVKLLSAGDYYIRVSGGGEMVQLYQLDVSVIPPLLSGDYNDDGSVNAADYTVWRNTLGQVGEGLAADGSGNEIVDLADYLVWKGQYGATNGQASLSAAMAVPEPTTMLLALVAAAYCFAWRRRQTGQRGPVPLRSL